MLDCTVLDFQDRIVALMRSMLCIVSVGCVEHVEDEEFIGALKTKVGVELEKDKVRVTNAVHSFNGQNNWYIIFMLEENGGVLSVLVGKTLVKDERGRPTVSMTTKITCL